MNCPMDHVFETFPEIEKTLLPYFLELFAVMNNGLGCA